VVDQRQVAGSAGSHVVFIYMAQMHIPSLNHMVYGEFAGLNLAAGGQRHLALVGRTFLKSFTLVYNGATGDVTITDNAVTIAAALIVPQ
jgi:hypothetical protein